MDPYSIKNNVSHQSLIQHGGQTSGAAVSDIVWLRLPQSRGRCPVSGLSRSAVNELVLPNPENGYRPPVVSIVLKKRHAVRGIRLVNRESLLTYLKSLVVEPAEPGPDEEGQEHPKPGVCQAEPAAAASLVTH